MPFPRIEFIMKRLKPALITPVFLWIGFFTSQVDGIEATTNPVGVIQISAPGNSDTLVSLPLIQPAVFNGVVGSYSGSAVTVSGSPGWTEDAWANGHYAFWRSGQLEGHYATILGNTADTLTLDTDADTLAVAAAGDRLSIHTYWTLGTLFPGGEGVNAATSHVMRDTEIMFQDPSEIGINQAADSIYYYLDGEWKKVGGDLNVDYRNAIIVPDGFFIVRHNTGVATTITFTGEVIMGKIALPLVFQDLSAQDNIVGLQRPIEMTLDEAGLGPNLGPGDALYVWDQSAAQQNRMIANADKYTYDGTAWRKNDGTDNVGSEQVFRPGVGFVIRKAIDTEVNQVIWVNEPNYGN